MARPLSFRPSFAPIEDGSGEHECIPSGIRPATGHGLPRFWDDSVDGEVTGETEQLTNIAVRASGRACLTLMTGIGAGQVISLDDAKSVVVGRSRAADVFVDDAGISRVHCRILMEGGICNIEDMSSRNGTFVNGARVRAARLTSGDRIQIGEAVLQLDIVDEAEERLARSLFEASTRDPLTSAYNRRYFMQRLETEISYARRHHAGLGIIMLDLDHFKAINDNWGHTAGDAVLRSVVEELERTVRSEDVLARYGGEEFAIVARTGSADELHRFAERLRTRIEALRIAVGGSALRVTVSIGVAELDECEGASPDELIGAADRRLYRAKLLGRNRVCTG